MCAIYQKNSGGRSDSVLATTLTLPRIIDDSMIPIVFILITHDRPHMEGAVVTHLMFTMILTSQNDALSRRRRSLLTLLISLSLYCTV
ncbi:hypothetical protein Y032_0047g1435 [Ancylostoma ceylanicum]|uniref:Uncharacterized protein n=1 Tax=Ancylostoma ceylanicum TaxID=53326 RepID=A0A016UBY6_9BILA|nr:hypothetical protein Y032_0047g1435 [Ancylostoma ceylanicum]